MTESERNAAADFATPRATRASHAASVERHMSCVSRKLTPEPFTFLHVGRDDMNSNEKPLNDRSPSLPAISPRAMHAPLFSASTRRAPAQYQSVRESDPHNDSEMLASLLAVATATLDTDRRAARSCIQRAATLLGIDLSSAEKEVAERPCVQGGLAPWQAKRLSSHIDDKLGSSISATNLAGLVELSASHFSRAFSKTFGAPPHAYIMRRRIQRAQELMLTSRLPLSQVALECGMCDQAHFCRVFRRIVGINPNAWRRKYPLDTAPDNSTGGSFAIPS